MVLTLKVVSSHGNTLQNMLTHDRSIWPILQRSIGHPMAVNGPRTPPAGAHARVPNRTRRQYRHMARDSTTFQDGTLRKSILRSGDNDNFLSCMWRAVSRGYVQPEHAEFVGHGLRWGFTAGVQRGLLKGVRKKNISG